MLGVRACLCPGPSRGRRACPGGRAPVYTTTQTKHKQHPSVKAIYKLETQKQATADLGICARYTKSVSWAGTHHLEAMQMGITDSRDSHSSGIIIQEDWVTTGCPLIDKH